MRLGNVAAGQDESTSVRLDEVAEPLCARPGADHYEHGRGGDLFTLAGPEVLERQGFQAGLAGAVGNSGAEPDFDVGGRLQVGDEAVGHAGGQRLALTSSVTPAAAGRAGVYAVHVSVDPPCSTDHGARLIRLAGS